MLGPVAAAGVASTVTAVELTPQRPGLPLVPIAVTLRARMNPVAALGVVLILGGAYELMGSRQPRDRTEAECAPEDAACEPGSRETAPVMGEAPALAAEEVCRGAGYLCAELSQQESIRVRRWKGLSGTLVVHVPRPEFEEPGDAIELQRAAAQGLRAWNNQPFPILIDMQGNRDPHFSVRWTRSLGGNRIGLAQTQWSGAEGLTVLGIELSTRSPYDPGRVSAPHQIRLTAAHEMGHALGLGHSTSERDVMYPTNTATAVSAQDRRTMEVLYRLADGTEIRR